MNPKMFGSELPSWRQLLKRTRKFQNCQSYWNACENIWTASSGVSVKLIIEAYIDLFGKSEIEIWLPDFFCSETENIFINEKTTLYHYPVTKNLEPDWNAIKQRIITKDPDIFLFVHYFGKYCDVSRAKVFCKKHECILIEDCAHVLGNDDKYGKTGDFVLYSPHKLLPVQDGAFIKVNLNSSKSYIEDIAKRLKEQLEREDAPETDNIWRIKKSIQKLFRIRRNKIYTIETHYGMLKKEILPAINISRRTYNILNNYSYRDIDKIAYIRRDNLRVMDYIIQQINPDIVALGEKNACPYCAVYSLENVNDKEKIMQKIAKKGMLTLWWPDLPSALRNEEGHEVAKQLSKDIFVVPIHQGMTPQYIIKKFSRREEQHSKNFRLKWVKNGSEGYTEWNSVAKEIEISNIPQDWIYGNVKCEKEHWEARRYIIECQEKAIGILQILLKKKCGIIYAVRINRGPLLIEQYRSAENAFEIMKILRKEIIHPIPFFYAPAVEWTPQNVKLASIYGWKIWNPFGFPSGVINLQDDINEIRKRLDSKWRNQLVSAEKNSFEIKIDNDCYKMLLEIYLEDQKEKGYQGVPNLILEELYMMDKSPLMTYYIQNREGKILAFDIFYMHMNIATYLVGWNGSEGRKLYLNNLLLYTATIHLKENGLLFMDLGGIEYINTKQIARFKEGMKPQCYRLLGELIRF